METIENRKEAILRERAKLLEKPLIKAEGDKAKLDIVVFRLSEERYALESRYIQEVFPLRCVTPLPEAPGFIYGLINVRRKVVSIINLKALFELEEQGTSSDNRVIILEGDAMRFGVLVDAVEGVGKVQEDSLVKALPMISGLKKEFLKGITQERLILLDGEKLLNSSSLIVNEKP